MAHIKEPSYDEASDDQHPHICLRVSDTILPWLTKEERSRNIVLLDFNADLEDDTTLRLDLNIAFNPQPIRRGLVTRADWYVGCTGVEVSVEADSGMVTHHTQAMTLQVDYSNTVKKQRKASLDLTPCIQAKNGHNDVKVKPGSIKHNALTDNVFSVKFKSEERFLQSIHLGNSVKWILSLPRGEKAIRDFLAGNLYLFCNCIWAQSSKSGEIVLRPSDIQFFDPERKPVGRAKSLLMFFVLWKNGTKLDNRDGFSTKFEEVPS